MTPRQHSLRQALGKRGKRGTWDPSRSALRASEWPRNSGSLRQALGKRGKRVTDVIGEVGSARVTGIGNLKFEIRKRRYRPVRRGGRVEARLDATSIYHVISSVNENQVGIARPCGENAACSNDSGKVPPSFLPSLGRLAGTKSTRSRGADEQ